MEQCLRSASYWAWRGALELQLEQIQAAQESLERALMLEPDLPGAQLDYAQVLVTLGDLGAAAALLAEVSERPDLSPALAQRLQPLILALSTENLSEKLTAAPTAATHRGTQQQAAPRYTRWRISSALGYDNNLNNAPAANQLSLSFDQGDLVLPLEESQRARAGASWLTNLHWQQLRPRSDGALWLLQAQVQQRLSSAPSSHYTHSHISAAWLQNPQAARQWQAQIAWRHLQFGGQSWLQGLEASTQHQWQLASTRPECRAGAGAEFQQRNYPSSTRLNGLYGGAALSLHCPTHSVQLRLGQDWANDSQRPGGHQQRVGLQWNAHWQRGVWLIDAAYDWSHQSDSKGYSPLFDNNRRRHSQRHSAQITLARQLGAHSEGGAQAFIQLGVQRQNSNLEAFTQRQASVHTGLRWGF